MLPCPHAQPLTPGSALLPAHQRAQGGRQREPEGALPILQKLLPQATIDPVTVQKKNHRVLNWFLPILQLRITQFGD